VTASGSVGGSTLLVPVCQHESCRVGPTHRRQGRPAGDAAAGQVTGGVRVRVSVAEPRPGGRDLPPGRGPLHAAGHTQVRRKAIARNDRPRAGRSGSSRWAGDSPPGTRRAITPKPLVFIPRVPSAVSPLCGPWRRLAIPANRLGAVLLHAQTVLVQPGLRPGCARLASWSRLRAGSPATHRPLGAACGQVGEVATVRPGP
jgi:hypothetical protein